MAFRIVCGPTGSGKTARAMDTFTAAMRRGDNPVFIAPSMPDARHFERQIIRSLGGSQPGVLSGGSVTTFNRLLRGLLRKAEPQAHVLDAAGRFQLMRVAVDSVKLRCLSRSAAFDGFVEALVNLVAEMEMLGFDFSSMDKLNPWAKRDTWRQDLLKDIFLIYQEYSALLKNRGVYDEELCQQRIQALMGEQPGLLEHQTVVVDGFWDFTPLQHDILERLAAAADELLLTLPHQEGRQAYEATAIQLERLARNAGDCEQLAARQGDGQVPALVHLVGNLFEESAEEENADGAVIPLTAAGDRGEAELVSAEILKLWRSGQSLDEIAVVCRSSAGPGMAVIAATLSDLGVPVELGAPVPLVQTPVGQTAMAALNCVAGSRQGRDHLLSFLRSPLSAEPMGLVDELDRLTRVRGIEDSQEVMRGWRKLGGSKLAGLDRLRTATAGGIQKLSQALYEMIRNLVSTKMSSTTLAIGEANLDIMGLQCLQSICNATLDHIHFEPEQDQVDALTFMKRSIATANVRPFMSNRRGCVRLLDPHRILNQRFDVVFICGLLEKRFPSLGREDSFFSDSDRRTLAQEFNLPLDSRANRLAEEKFLFHRTCSRARKRVYLCYPYCDKEGKPAVRSLFVDAALGLFSRDSLDPVERWIGEVAFAAPAAPTVEQGLRSLALAASGSHWPSKELAAAAAPADLEKRLSSCLAAAKPPPSPRITDESAVADLHGKDSFQVTELQRYLGCPCRYFIEFLLKPTHIEPLAHVMRRGQLVHKILCRFGSLLPPGLILANADDAQIEQAKKQMAGIIKEEFRDAGQDIESLIMQTELTKHLQRYIERERCSGRKLRYYDFETSFGDAPADCGGRQSEASMLIVGGCNIRGRIDRIDWLEGTERAMVVDYKTGKEVPSLDRFEKDKEIQIPLYMKALKDVFGFEPIGGEYYSIRGDKRGGVYLAGYEEELGLASGQINKKNFLGRKEFVECVDAAVKLAEAAIAGIRSGDFPIDPLPKECDFCGYEALCRHQHAEGGPMESANDTG